MPWEKGPTLLTNFDLFLLKQAIRDQIGAIVNPSPDSDPHPKPKLTERQVKARLKWLVDPAPDVASNGN